MPAVVTSRESETDRLSIAVTPTEPPTSGITALTTFNESTFAEPFDSDIT